MSAASKEAETGTAARRPRAVWCLTIFLVAVACRIGLAAVTGAFDREPSGEVARVAQALAAGDGFANPNGAQSGPTVHVAPIYPFLLAALIEAVPSMWLPVVVTTINLLVASLIWALLPVAAVSLELPIAAGIIGGLIGALNPLYHWTELNGYWESTLSGLVLLLVVLATANCRSRLHAPGVAAGIGFLWGLAILLQPAVVPVLFVVLATIVTRAAQRRRMVAPLAVASIALVITLTPWTIRNYQTMGGFVFVRGNLGIELSVSNNDGALPSQENVLQNPQARHPHVDATEFARRAMLGELEYNRSRLGEAAEWMQRNPVRFLSLTAQRAWLFWIAERSHVVLTLAQWGLAVLALAGLWFASRITGFGATIIGGVWLTYPLLYYLVQADMRYRYPIEWSIVLAAGVAAAGLLERVPGVARLASSDRFAVTS